MDKGTKEKTLVLIDALKMTFIENQQYQNAALLRDIEKDVVDRDENDFSAPITMKFDDIEHLERVLNNLKETNPESYIELLKRYENK